MYKRALAAAAVLSVLVLPGRAEILEQILVKVNGDIITKTEFEQRQITFLRQTNRTDVLRDDAVLKQVLMEITPQLIVEAIDELLLLQRGRELGYRLSDEQFATVLENIKKENKIESDEQLKAALEQEDMTMADLRRALEKQMVVSRVQQVEVFGRTSVTEEEERAYYRSHQDEFSRPATVTLREIMVEVPGMTADGKPADPGAGTAVNVGLDEEARAQAEAARARVTAGEDFAAVAAEVSDVPSKADGGLIGPIAFEELSPTLQKTLETLKIGDVGPILRTARGYQLIKLESRSDVAAAPFEEVQQQIAEKIALERRRGEFEKYVIKLRDQAIIEWKNEDLRKAFEQRVGARDPAAPPS